MQNMLRNFVFEQYKSYPLERRAKAARRIAPDATPSDHLRLWLVPSLLPDLVSAVEQVIVGAEDEHYVRGFAGGLLTYVYNPFDLIEDEAPFGFADDALVCALGLQLLQEKGFIDLDADVSATCAEVSKCLPALSADLRTAIEDFVEKLSGSTESLSIPESRN